MQFGQRNNVRPRESDMLQPNGTFSKHRDHGQHLRQPVAGVRAELPCRQWRVRFPGEDGGRSLAEMAQRDLDAALQLLADRAQFITGASGAAIALRRQGKNDMLCRASTGSNAPELGALLSTEFGLSGESVRTRQPLRCDDAERDARVNHDVCRQLGIASVVVMPVVNDDEVLGVFELFLGEGERLWRTRSLGGAAAERNGGDRGPAGARRGNTARAIRGAAGCFDRSRERCCYGERQWRRRDPGR